MIPDDAAVPGCRSADVAAYALGALEPLEARTFERHLEQCAVCPVELSSFQAVVDEMAASTPPHPAPRALKQRVMRAVADEPRHRAEQPAPRRRRRLTLRVPFGATGLAFGGAMAFAAAAVVVAVIALPGRMGNRTIDASVPGSGAASLHISGGHAEIVLHHFAAPPKGKIYEVWLQHGNTTSPTTALFSVPRDGSTTVDVPGSLYGVSHVLVTPEPAGGSTTPTHSPVVNATL